MDRAIRRMWMSAACVFVLLMGTLSYIQFFDSKTLMANPWNSRALYDNYGSARGSIVVDGTEIASSVKSDDEYNYQRVYNHPLKYAALTGYFSTIYGATGLEAAMDKELAGTSDSQFYDRVAQLFSGSSAQGASVELTINSKLQDIAYNALQGRKGAVVALNPKTGEILAMASSPSYDPNLLSSHSGSSVIANYQALTADEDHPLFNRAIAGNTYSPGSTFKIIDAVAALESGKYNAESRTPRSCLCRARTSACRTTRVASVPPELRRRLSGRWRSPVTPRSRRLRWIWVRSALRRPPRTSVTARI